MEPSPFSSVSIGSYVTYLAEHKKLILKNFVVTLVLTTIVVFLLPKQYKSSFSFLPPIQSSGYSALLDNMKIGEFGGGNQPSSAQVIYMLNSRTLRVKLVEKFDLIKRYRLTRSRNKTEDALKKLDKRIKIEDEITGGFATEDIVGVSVAVVDDSPDTAYLMAKCLNEELEKLFVEVYSRKAEVDKDFYEKRIGETEKRLKEAQNALELFQSTNKVFSPDAQFGYMVKLHSDLELQIEQKKIELNLIKQNLDGSSSTVTRLVTEIGSLERELERIRTLSKKEIIPSLSTAPQLFYRYLNLQRDLELQEKSYLVLFQQYKQAELQSKKDLPILLIIDHPVRPEYKFRPKRILVILSIMLVETTFFLLLLAFFKYKAENLDRNEHYRAFIDALRK
ncbi:MAG: hypothetical protein A2293_07810 [Elusimicrobia bacterium RIFOXYB2_FULL_49_7]|nr:MAG: hypothetical protein A2293_07810 [Elusimicrobia bacterium RIFOXYB2_FULL_49_7]